MGYKVNYLSSVEGTGKKSGRAYFMMTILISVYENTKVVQSYTTNIFLNEEQFHFVKELAPMQELEVIFVPTARGMQIIQLDIAG